MKKILSIIAIAALGAASFTACNNKPPYEKLITAVDSLNTVVHSYELPMTDSCAIKYDELTNTVKYLYYCKDSIDSNRLDSVIDDMQQQFLLSIITGDPNMTHNLLDAKANILMQMNGRDNTKFEIMTENDQFNELYKELGGK